MDAALHRIESLPGDGRYAMGFQNADGSEHSAVVQARDTAAGIEIDVAEASLPSGWTRDSEAFLAAADAVRAVARSRAASRPASGTLRDPDGGWDVSLGNVVLDDEGLPSCIAHGQLLGDGAGRWVCPDCGAQALHGGG